MVPPKGAAPTTDYGTENPTPREMANQNKKKRTFKQGDLLSVRKQETSKEAAEGKPAKLTLKGRGTYMLLEEASNNSYHVQKHLAMQSFMTRFPYSVTRFPYVDTWMRVRMSLSTALGIGARVTNFTTDIISWPFGVQQTALCMLEIIRRISD